MMMMMMMTILIIITINLIHIAQFDTNGILSALYIVIKYTNKTHHMHSCIDTHEYSYPCAYTGLRVYRYECSCISTHEYCVTAHRSSLSRSMSFL